MNMRSGCEGGVEIRDLMEVFESAIGLAQE